MNKLILKLAFISAVVCLSSCGGDSDPGYEIMPNMYRSPSLETYGENTINNQKKYLSRKETAKLLIQKGANVIVTGRSEIRLIKAKEYSNAAYIVFDISKTDEIKNKAKTTETSPFLHQTSRVSILFEC